jgi:hypothetical protein
LGAGFAHPHCRGIAFSRSFNKARRSERRTSRLRSFLEGLIHINTKAKTGYCTKGLFTLAMHGFFLFSDFAPPSTRENAPLTDERYSGNFANSSSVPLAAKANPTDADQMTMLQRFDCVSMLLWYSKHNKKERR